MRGIGNVLPRVSHEFLSFLCYTVVARFQAHTCESVSVNGDAGCTFNDSVAVCDSLNASLAVVTSFEDKERVIDVCRNESEERICWLDLVYQPGV